MHRLRMQVVLHAGAHKTDDDRLIKCLANNTDMLSGFGTNVPAPTSYRKLLREIINSAVNEGIKDSARDVFLDAVAREGAIDRLVLSNFGFFGTPKMAVGPSVIYPASVGRLSAFFQLFPNDETELFLAICNPATFFPALFEQTNFNAISDLTGGVAPTEYRWSELLTRIHTQFPDLPITVWCNEDLPLIWSQVLREMGGLDPHAAFDGEYSFLAEIMTDNGMKRFETYIDGHPGMTEIQKRRVISAFLDKFARDDAVEEEFELPGWTDELVDELTEIYDEDVFAISRMPGVNLISP